MKIYNVSGYIVLLVYALACGVFAPQSLGPVNGALIGSAYLIALWFLAGLYLSDLIHLGIAHRSLDYKEWFMKAVTVLNNSVGVYVDPIKWVNRHRHHHKHSDHEGDPNKLEVDGFWRTMYLCIFPYPCTGNLAHDAILKSFTFRLVSNQVFAVVAQSLNFALLWWAFGSLPYALTLWCGFRAFALWVNMIQNYWTHDRRFGYRRYNDAHDNAMNLREWLPVTASFSACFQNNHHHYPNLLRLSHDDSEYDFGFITVKWMKAMGLVKAAEKGLDLPKGFPMADLGF